MILYIAGPMTGIPEMNFPAFNNTARQLLDAGYEVLNPTRHGRDIPGWKWIDYLLPCLRDVDAADGVALLDGWARSRGAPVEIKLAQMQDKPINPLSVWLRPEVSERWSTAAPRVSAPINP
jgi:hypothetical protein